MLMTEIDAEKKKS